MPGMRRQTRRLFRDPQPLAGDIRRETGIFLGVDDIDTAGLHRDGACRKRCEMRLGINAARKARDSAEPRLAKIPGQPARHANAQR